MPKKKFGQNFLNNNSIVNKILFSEKISSKNILEIGPGNLILTKSILNKLPKKYVGIEIDQDLLEQVKDEKIKNNLIQGDALKINELSFFNNETFSIISNLPFNISSQLLIKWCILHNKNNCIDEMLLMFQKELGERIIAKVNTKKYGGLSILAQSVFSISERTRVEKIHFNPKPKVDAIVLKFKALEQPNIKKGEFQKLQKITKFFFNERRKKNKKKFLKFFSFDQIKKNNFDKFFNLRAENLDKNFYYELTKII